MRIELSIFFIPLYVYGEPLAPHTILTFIGGIDHPGDKLRRF
jgi:hypothetical protein